MYKTLLVIVFVFLSLGRGPKAQTVGVIEITESANNGYTLFSPTINNSIYLIDQCGQKINEWTTEKNPGMMAKLDLKGNLFHVGRTPSPEFSGGGIGGTLTGLDWENNEIYSINLAQNDFHQHHDLEILPNGNILVLGWQFVSFDSLKALGREVANENGLWSESVRELELINKTEYNVVWEWRLIDHVMQDVDPTLPNFGVVQESPNRININFTNGQSPNTKDWLHCNSLDYNPELDQIIINCRNFNEFWIIDHSTSTEEAASSEGGISGMGGDILYRWGNPSTYESGTEENRVFYGQHDAHWIPAGLANAGKIRVFNNGLGRPEGAYSTIETIDPPLQGFSYEKTDLQAFGPIESEVLYGAADGDQFFYSQRISGSQQLANGNTLICIGARGRFLEINEDKEIEWQYVNPSGIQIATQGNPVTNGSNSVFQTVTYQPSFEGFEGKDLSPGDKIELEPIDNCDIVYTEEHIDGNLKIYYAKEQIIVENENHKNVSIAILDLQGKLIHEFRAENEAIIRHAISLPKSGIYVVQCISDSKHLQTVKIPVFYE